MMFNCGLSADEQRRRYRIHMTNWHKHFCLWPRVIKINDDKTTVCCWLGYCLRKAETGYEGYWHYEYRPLT